jgi:membrane associated rhomboid family serine protease
MKRDIQRIMLATAVPLFLIFILFLLKIVEVGMDWDFSHMGIYPLEKRGITGILTHPLIHSGFSHLRCRYFFYHGACSISTGG